MPEPSIHCLEFAGNDFSTVETYVSSEEVAKTLVQSVVGNKLASTAHIEKVQSCYWWENEPVHDSKLRVAFDVASCNVERTVAFIQEEHPYDLPGIYVYPFKAGERLFAKWLENPDDVP